MRGWFQFVEWLSEELARRGLRALQLFSGKHPQIEGGLHRLPVL